MAVKTIKTEFEHTIHANLDRLLTQIDSWRRMCRLIFYTVTEKLNSQECDFERIFPFTSNKISDTQLIDLNRFTKYMVDQLQPTLFPWG